MRAEDALALQSTRRLLHDAIQNEEYPEPGIEATREERIRFAYLAEWCGHDKLADHYRNGCACGGEDGYTEHGGEGPAYVLACDCEAGRRWAEENGYGMTVPAPKTRIAPTVGTSEKEGAR